MRKTVKIYFYWIGKRFVAFKALFGNKFKFSLEAESIEPIHKKFSPKILLIPFNIFFVRRIRMNIDPNIAQQKIKDLIIEMEVKVQQVGGIVQDLLFLLEMQEKADWSEIIQKFTGHNQT